MWKDLKPIVLGPLACLFVCLHTFLESLSFCFDMTCPLVCLYYLSPVDLKICRMVVHVKQTTSWNFDLKGQSLGSSGKLPYVGCLFIVWITGDMFFYLCVFVHIPACQSWNYNLACNFRSVYGTAFVFGNTMHISWIKHFWLASTLITLFHWPWLCDLWMTLLRAYNSIFHSFTNTSRFPWSKTTGPVCITFGLYACDSVKVYPSS